MKIIHCADLHLDSKMESNFTKEQAIIRREELMSTFIRMIEFAKENEVSIIMIAGDLFDTSQNTQVRIKRRVLEQIESTPEIDFLYLRGNHDKVDFFETLEMKPNNLKTFTEGWTSYNYGNISIYGCELNKDISDRIYSELVLHEERTNIVILHGQESKYDNKQDAEIIKLNQLQNKNIDYLALGHIHSYKYAKLDHRGYYCYSGCLEGRGFDECGEKGFVLLDIDNGIVNHEFIPFAKRRLHEIELDLSDYMNEIQIKNAINDATAILHRNDLLKLILKGDVDEELEIDVKHLLECYKERFYFLKIYDHTALKIKYEDFANDISLKGEFIRIVEAEDMDEELKKQIILIGLKALAGREIDI